MDAYVRPFAMALRVAFGLGLGFLGILLCGVAGANAAAELPSGSSSVHDAPRSGHGHERSNHGRLVQRTVASTGKLVRGTASAVSDNLGKTTEKIRPSKTATRPQTKSTPAASGATKKATKKTGARWEDTSEASRAAMKEAHPVAATQNVRKAATKNRQMKGAQQPKSSVAGVASELKTSIVEKAAPKAANQPVRNKTAAVTAKVKKTTENLGTQVKRATRKPSGSVANEPPERPIRNVVSQVSKVVERPMAKVNQTSGTLVKDVPLDQTIDAVAGLPSALAEPPVKEALSMVTTALDATVARAPVVNKVLPKQLISRTTGPVVELADGRVDAVVSAVVSPVAHVADSVLEPISGVVNPLVGGVADTVDAVIAPVARMADPVLEPIVGAVEPVLGGVADTVDPIAVPVADTVAPVVDTADVVLEVVDPSFDVAAQIGADSTRQSPASPLMVEDEDLARSTNTAGSTPAHLRPALAERAPGSEVMGQSATIPEPALLDPVNQPWSSSTTAGATASGETTGNVPAPQHMPSPLAAQGSSAGFGNGGGPQMPVGAFENSPFAFVLNAVSQPTSETSRHGPRGASNDPGSTPD